MNKIVTLLTAVIMSVAAILAFWSSNMIKQTLSSAENATKEYCSGAMFRLYSGSYDKENKVLQLILENQRTVDLQLRNLYLVYPNGEMKTYQLNELLKGNMLKSIRVEGVEDGFDKGTIKTNCPEVSVEFSYSEVTR